MVKLSEERRSIIVRRRKKKVRVLNPTITYRHRRRKLNKDAEKVVVTDNIALGGRERYSAWIRWRCIRSVR